MKHPLAFLDSFAGLVPCKVLSVVDQYPNGALASGSGCKMAVKITATRGAYKRGETLESDALRIIPRSHVRGLRSRSCSPRIIGRYRWQPDTQPSAAELNQSERFTAPGSRWHAETRGDGSRLAIFYPSGWNPSDAASVLRSMGVSGPYSSLSGPCLEFPATV